MSKKKYLFSISSHPDATSINSLDITLLKPDIDFSSYDYFIITSKQTSEFLKQYSPESLKPALCISKASAKSYATLGGTILDIGLGYGDDLALKIKEYSKDTKWLYLRAKVVASDFVSQCQKSGFNIDELIAYKSDCSQEIKNIKVEDDATLIFTSPSSVKCFLINKTIYPTNKVIVIGKTTASSLPSNIECKIAKENTIESCMELI